LKSSSKPIQLDGYDEYLATVICLPFFRQGYCITTDPIIGHQKFAPIRAANLFSFSLHCQLCIWLLDSTPSYLGEE